MDYNRPQQGLYFWLFVCEVAQSLLVSPFVSSPLFTERSCLFVAGPSRRYPQAPPASSSAASNENNFFTMDYSTNVSGFNDGQRQSASHTPGPVSGPPQQQPPVQPAFNQNPYGAAPTGFGAPMDQSFGGPSPYGGAPPPQHQQHQQQQQFNNYMPGPGGPPAGPPGPQQQGPGFGAAFAPQQQFLMAAGEQLFTNPMTKAAIDAYSQSLVDRGTTWIGGVSVGGISLKS